MVRESGEIKGMEIKERVAVWLDELLKDAMPVEAKGIYFGLYENKEMWQLRLIGAKVFDEDPGKWTAKMVYMPENVMSWKQDIDMADLLEEIADGLKIYLKEGKCREILKEKRGVVLVDNKGHFQIVYEKDKEKPQVQESEESFLVRPSKQNWKFAVFCIALLIAGITMDGVDAARGFLLLIYLVTGLAASFFALLPLPGFKEVKVKENTIEIIRFWIKRKVCDVGDVEGIKYKKNRGFYRVCIKEGIKKKYFCLDNDDENVEKFLDYIKYKRGISL
ncbi:MAG TPA: hypothetical protein VIR32_00505 [Lachnospiraceae bacterium]